MNTVLTVLYGIDCAGDAVKAACADTFESLKAAGHTPSFLAAHGPGFTRKYVTYRRRGARLFQSDFAAIQNFELCFGPPDLSSIPVKLSADFMIHREWARYCLVEKLPANGLIADAITPAVVDRAIKILKPGYGFSLTMPSSCGPMFWALGMIFSYAGERSSWSQEEGDNVCRWAGQAHVEQTSGVLRDVYPVNYLTEVHLNRQIGGIPLRRSIEADVSRGTMDTKGSISVWRVNERSINGIRAELDDVGLLFRLPPPPVRVIDQKKLDEANERLERFREEAITKGAKPMSWEEWLADIKAKAAARRLAREQARITGDAMRGKPRSAK